MKIRNTFIALAAVAALVACTKQQVQEAQAVQTVAVQACEVVFTATDPALAPLCTTANDVAVAIEDLEEQNAQALIAKSADGGVIDPRLLASENPLAPTNAQVYQYLAAHGAKPVQK